MQSFSLYASTTLVFVVLITCTSCDTLTTPTGTATSTTLANNDTSPASSVATNLPAQNEDPKGELENVTPTRLPTNYATTLPSKPALLHELTSMKPGVMLNGTNDMVNATGKMGSKSSMTDEKKAQKDGASRGSPGFVVTSVMILIISAIYA